MNKSNVIRSTKFYLNATDTINLLYIDETGTQVTTELYLDGSTTAVAGASESTSGGKRTIQITVTESGTYYIEIGLDPSSTASFDLQMWVTRTGQRAIDWLQSMSLSFASFMGGNVWLHNSDDVSRCNLFGEQKDCKVGVVVNENPATTKVFDSLAIYTDGEWEVESVTIPADKNYPHGMYSKIPKENFINREGVAYSEFLRNMKTTSSSISYVEALSGEPLRGNYAYVILKNTETAKVQLVEIDFNLTKSR